jgi:hypothetical protein
MSRGNIAVARSSTFSLGDDQPTRLRERSATDILSEFGTRWVATASPSTAASRAGKRSAGAMQAYAARGILRAIITRSAAPPPSCIAQRAQRDSMNGLSEGIEVNRFDQVHVEARLS